jgi:5'-3' exonuclease
MSYTVLLDTSSLMYRAFFAIPASLVGTDGQAINAVHGYLDMTGRLLRDLKPEYLVHVYDHDWRPAPRVALYAGYKADRPDDPPELPPQFDLLREVLDALGADQAEAPEWEADDAIGVLCAQGSAEDRIDVITGDRDLLQLVRDQASDDAIRATVRVSITVKGVGELATFDEAAVVEKYGVPSRRYVDFAILRGDPSDGLPGVKGIGEKTARSLVERYPSLDALLGDADAQTPRLATNLHAATDYIAAMRGVVPVRTNVQVRRWSGTPDETRLVELGERHKLAGAIKRLRASGSS